MSANIGSRDRTIRLVLGIVLIVLGIWLRGFWLLAVLVGAVLVVTGLVRVCPAYTLLGFRTNKT